MVDFIKSLVSNVNKAMRTDPGRGTPLPRKGLFNFINTTVNKKQQRQFVLNSATLGRLANTDPITWSIRRTIKGFISGIPWDIVPDTQQVEVELARWEDTIITYINPYKFDSPNFKTEILTKDLQQQVAHKVDVILDDSSINDTDRRDRIRWLFKSICKQVKWEAESHKHKAKAIFEHPNNSETSFRVLLELLLDDVMIYDAGVLIKNYNYYGQLAELYTIPGQELKIYRNEDGTMPDPPEAAYAWEDKGVLRAEFANDELLYIMQNPQHNGYGNSPLEVAAYIITASLYADEYNIDYFKHSNVPPGIVNLGENVTEDQRKLFQKLWEQEVQGRGGLHKLVFTAGSDKIDFVPMRTQTNRDMQMMEYLKWTTAIKCACYGISPQDIGFVLDFHRTTSEVQERLSKTRGVNNLLNLLTSYFNEEIVKSEFPFKDVKFAWETEETKGDVQEAQIDGMDIKNGVLNINERRQKLGLKPIEGGDAHMIQGGSGMIPVSDLAKIDEASIDPNQSLQPGQVPGNPLVDPSAAAQPATSGAIPKSNPGPVPQDKIWGDAGRPTGSIEQNPNDQITVKVNKNIPVKEQHEMLDKTVASLKDHGIKAVLKIQFDEDTKK